MKKRILSIILVCAMMFAVISSMSIGVSAAVTAPKKYSYASPADSITIDGEIDDAWDKAALNTLTVDAKQDSRGDEATRKDSSKVEFRAMYDANRVYLLFEIYDDTWIAGTGAKDWQNDSVFLVITEDSENGSNGSWGETAYILCAYPDTTEGKTTSDLFFARSGSNNGEKDIAVKEIDANHRVMELSFELNTKTPVLGDFIYLDVQFNDADRDSNGSTGDQNRTIVWNWSCNNANGTSAGNGRSDWGRIDFIDYDPTKMHPNKTVAAPAADAVSVDGVIDAAWDNAAINLLETEAFMDSRGNADVRKDSSTVKFRVMYKEGKVYMLFEIYDKDGDWRFGNATNWRNDSIFICVSEIAEPEFTDSNGIALSKIVNAQYGEAVYTMNVYPDSDTSKTVNDLFFVRSGKGTNDLAKEIAVKEVDAQNRIVELSFELNTVDPAGNSIFLDVQYNDADNPDNKEEGSTITADSPRAIVWNWSTDDLNGLSAGNGGPEWGRIDFAQASQDDEAEIEPSLAGDYYVSDMDGNVLYLLNFNNGALTVVDKTEEDGADYSGEYTYNGTFDTGIKVYDASGAETGISITNMRGRYFFNTTPMGMGNLMSAGQPPVKPVMKLGDNAYNVTITSGWAEGVEVSFTAEKAGKYTLSAAGGEDNAEVSVIADYSSEMVDLPYEFVLDEGETVKFYISSTALLQSEDEINLVLSLEGENAETGDLGVMIAVVALVAVLGMGITAVTSRRVSVK